LEDECQETGGCSIFVSAEPPAVQNHSLQATSSRPTRSRDYAAHTPACGTAVLRGSHHTHVRIGLGVGGPRPMAEYVKRPSAPCTRLSTYPRGTTFSAAVQGAGGPTRTQNTDSRARVGAANGVVLCLDPNSINATTRSDRSVHLALRQHPVRARNLARESSLRSARGSLRAVQEDWLVLPALTRPSPPLESNGQSHT
jgi:hypothetical protein